jgi:hypothetical protein
MECLFRKQCTGKAVSESDDDLVRRTRRIPKIGKNGRSRFRKSNWRLLTIKPLNSMGHNVRIYEVPPFLSHIHTTVFSPVTD